MSRNPYDTDGISLILLVDETQNEKADGRQRTNLNTLGFMAAIRSAPIPPIAPNKGQKSLLVNGQGGPLAIVVAPANVNDHFLLKETIGRSWSSARGRQRKNRSICVWMPATTIR